MHSNTTTTTTSVPAPRRAKRWIVASILTAVVAVTGLAGANAAADGHGRGFGGHGRHHGPMDAASAAKHIDKLVERVAGDGTPQQKARLAEIAKSAFADLQGTHAEFRAAHARVHTLLMQPAIDRVALEQLRAEQIARMDKVSKRLLTAVEDAAEVLTPEQRVRFHELMKKRMH